MRERCVFFYPGDDYNGLIRRLSGGNKEGARKVLKEIVADPQQKLAKLQVSTNLCFYLPNIRLFSLPILPRYTHEP